MTTLRSALYCVTMSHNGVIEAGQSWVFIHSSGTRTEYVVSRMMLASAPSPDGKSPGLAAVYSLVNRATGGEAMVSEAWLRAKPSRYCYWERVDAPMEAVEIGPQNDERPEPIVIAHNGPRSAWIGPFNAWAVGDRVTIPPRGPKCGDAGLPGFEGEVSGVMADGLATVVQATNDEGAIVA